MQSGEKQKKSTQHTVVWLHIISSLNKVIFIIYFFVWFINVENNYFDFLRDELSK